jgi:hypothetical protein
VAGDGGLKIVGGRFHDRIPLSQIPMLCESLNVLIAGMHHGERLEGCATADLQYSVKSYEVQRRRPVREIPDAPPRGNESGDASGAMGSDPIPSTAGYDGLERLHLRAVGRPLGREHSRPCRDR